MSVKATNWAWELGRSGAVKGGELLTLLRIADHADNDGICWPGADYLAEYTSQGERTVRRHLTDLEKAGLLHRERVSRDEGRGRSYDGIILHLGDQPANLAGKKSPDQPANDDRPTGQSVHDQPANDDTPIDREPTEEPSGTEVCSTATLSELIDAPLRQAADAKGGHLDPDAVVRACKSYPGRDHAGEAEKFAAWHLRGNGVNAPLRDVAPAFRSWLENAPVSPPRSQDGSSAPKAITTEPVAETDKATEAWKAAKQLLSQQLPDSTFRVWIDPLEVAGERDGKLVLVDTSSNGVGVWVNRRYRALVLEATEGFDNLEIVDETQLELEAA